MDVSGLTSGFAAVAAGFAHTCALTTMGGVKCWGSGGYGQLGDGTIGQYLTPVDVTSLSRDVAAVALGRWRTWSLTTAGDRLCA